MERVREGVARAGRYLHRQPRRVWALLALLLLLPILVLGPLYAMGYILHFDMVFSPYVPINLMALREGALLHHGLAVTMLLKAASLAVPMDIVQKVLLSGIFVLAAYGMYRAVPVRSTAARLLAGLIYAVNPFVYDRLMAGHWRFLLAYSLTPFVLRAFFGLYVHPGRKQMLYAVLWWSGVIVVNAHHAILLGLLFGVLGAAFVRSRLTLGYALAVPVVVLLLQLWWLVPTAGSANVTDSFGLDHLAAFATRADPEYGLWFNMLSLQGFWYDGWQSVKDVFSFWPLLVLGWLLPVFVGLAGLRVYTPAHRRLIAGLLVTGAVALILAAGLHPDVWRVNSWLYAHVPGMAGMREPQKFLALLALVYAVIAAFGIDLLMRCQRRKTAFTLAAVSAMASVLLTWPMFWGARGQLTVSHYPDTWRQFRQTLDADKSDSRVLILPWPVYTTDTFTGTLVANPARQYYGDRAIISQQMNLPGAADWAAPAHRSVQEALADKDARRLVRALRQLNVKYIAITGADRAKSYAWLLHGTGLAEDVTTPEKNMIILTLTSR